MISPKIFYELLRDNEMDFFTGVPDSTLKQLCSYITDNVPPERNIVTANEGNAIGLASGYYLSTNNPAIVYMQNSGLGNCVNPLTSLTDEDVYSVPMLLIIGWRGEPGKKDEPQHARMGKITLDMLDVLKIPYSIVPNTIEETEIEIGKAITHMENHKTPYALIVRKGTFTEHKLQNTKTTNYPLNREQAIRTLVPLLEDDAIVVSTTGKTSRELFEFREELQQGHERDFLTVGSMGHSSSIALGVALQKPGKKVYCFDGDGALIMHMGALSTIGQLQPKNLCHIVLNNFAHDSVGGQPTAADNINIPQVAQANGYKNVFSAQNEEEIRVKMKEIQQLEGPTLLEIKVNKGARKELGRPTSTPKENKEELMEFILK
jgi:phosphonopyruvate decarboxylase